MQTLLARAMREMLLLASLALLSCVASSIGSSSDYEYFWVARANGQYHCTEIPRDMQLCHDVGYKYMMLPNLLEHETMSEVRQQAGSWVPLVRMQCHPDTQVFLCTIFAPVCFEKAVHPCRLLCESVRDACSPIMEAYGFFWPEMFNCSKFPLEEKEICIHMNGTQTLESERRYICPQCDMERNAEVFKENMCSSGFAIRAKIKKTKTENMDKKVILQKKKNVLWEGALSPQELKKLVLYVKNGAHCPCEQLDNTKNHHLIMGRKVEKHYLLTGIYQWDEKDGEFRKLLHQIKTHTCPATAIF